MALTPDSPSATGTDKSAARQSTLAELRELYRFVSPIRRTDLLVLAALVFTGALWELASVAGLFFFLATITGSSSADNSVVGKFAIELARTLNLNQVAFASAVLILVIVGTTIVRLALNWKLQKFSSSLGHDLTVTVQKHILMQPYAYFTSQSGNPTIAGLEHVQVVVYQVVYPILAAASSAVLAAFLIVAISLVNFEIAAAAFATLLVFYGIIFIFVTPILTRISNVCSEAYTRRIMIASESVGGIRDVIINQAQPIFLNEFGKEDAVFSHSRATVAFIGLAPRFLIEAIGFIVIAILALIVSQDDAWATALPTLGALALGAQRLLPLVQQVYASAAATAGNRAFLRETLVWLNLPLTQLESKANDPPLAFKDHILFDRVSFRYVGRQVGALEDINIRIEMGSRIALAGPTGSGKSTFADLLMGLLEPSTGCVRVDGIPLTPDNLHRWWKNIAHVPQAIFLADGTIAENIIFGAGGVPDTQSRVIEAAVRAHLHEFVMSLPEGYETGIGEKGIRLSGGERQRLGIARAIYKGAQVLVLDEPTSALDADAEEAILQMLDELTEEGKTIVLISHRPLSVANADRIIRLSHGRVTSA